MKKSNTFRLVILGIFTAIAIILTFTPLGYIPITPAFLLTTIHIPIIVAAVLFGLTDGAIIGTVTGLLCIAKAAFLPQMPTDPYFVNPLISLVPRILIGVVAALVFTGMLKLFKNSSSRPHARAIATTVAAIAATLTNTVGVLTAFGLLHPDIVGISGTGEIFSVLIVGTLLSNGIFEIIAAIVLAVPIVLAVDKARSRGAAA